MPVTSGHSAGMPVNLVNSHCDNISTGRAFAEIRRNVKIRKLDRLGNVLIHDAVDESVLPEGIRLWTHRTVEGYIGAWGLVCGCHRISILHVLVVVFAIRGDFC